MKKEESKYINYQLIVLVLTILAGFISLFLTYNQKLNLEHKKSLVSKKNLLLISYLNRVLFLLTGILFLLINIKLYELSKRENENLKPYELQIIASILVVASEIIVLYVTSKSNTADIENPNM